MAEDNYENRQNELPDYNQEYYESFLDDPMVFAIRGEIPEMKLHNEKLDWIDQNNDYLRATLKSEEVKKYRENCPLNYMFSSNINGALLIEVEIQNKGKFDEEEFVNSVYPMYQKIANDQGIKNIPIYFAYYNLSDSAPEDRDDPFSSVFGGLQIARSGGSSTACFAGEKSNGDKGLVITGHSGSVGDDFYQPTVNNQYLIGQIDEQGNDYADCAWIETDDVIPRVYGSSDYDLKRVKSYGDTSLNTFVYMSGKTSDVISGTVYSVVAYYNHPTHGTMNGLHYRASYNSSSGDSGAPVYTLTTGGINIVGIHAVGVGANAVFSGVEGIEDDLDVTPIIF